jgi:hypothetical protein
MKSSDEILRDIYSKSKKKENKTDENDFTYLNKKNVNDIFEGSVPSVLSGNHSGGLNSTDEILGENNPFVNSRVSNNSRRMSFEKSIPAATTGVSGNLNPAATLVVTPYVISEDMKMKFITLSSLKRLLEQYSLFKASTYDNTKTLIFFINAECQKQLVLCQQRLWTPLIEGGLNLQNVYLLKDKHTEDMISDYIRPTSRDDYVIKLNGAVTKPPWSKDYEFDVAVYETKIFPHVVIFLQELETYDHYLRRGATPYQLDFMPKMELGKATTAGSGMWRIALDMLNNKNFLTLLKEENLKVIKSMKDFVTYFSAKNIELCKLSRELKHHNTLMKEPEDYKTISALARKKSDDYKQFKERGTKPAVPTRSRGKFTRYVKNSLNEIVPVDFETSDEAEEFVYTIWFFPNLKFFH